MPNKKNCLIISYGPVPTPEYQKIEGGGQRCWGLALGMKKNGYDVTIAINNSFPLDVIEVEDIRLVNWSEDEALKDLINTFDTVVMNYAMGGPMSFVVDAIADTVRLVLDCYVPIYIEVSARDADDKVTEYSNYSHDILHYNKALKRGDYFLCANVPQKHMYIGALSALGIINPYSYKTPRVLLVPFGVESAVFPLDAPNPYLDNFAITPDDFTLLWFGGLYPWFNIKPLLKTIEKLTNTYPRFKFVIVGGKNPYNQNPDFVKQYDTTHTYFTDRKMVGKSVFFMDWVDFSQRLNWYRHASAVISINNEGEENIYSWRTRVMDYVWGEVPMVTNGGDPLSDSLLLANAAIRLEDTSVDKLFDTLSSLVIDPSLLVKAKENLKIEKNRYHWEKVVQPLIGELSKDFLPYLDEKTFVALNKPDSIEELEQPISPLARKARKLSKVPRKVVRLIRNKGVKRSAKVMARAGLNRIQKSTHPNRRQYYFFSHPLDFTGAPMVLMDLVEDFSKKLNPKDLNVCYPGGEAEMLSRLFAMGVKTDKAVLGVGSRVLHAQMNIRPNDFVLMNTVAIYPNYRDYVLGLLDTNRLNRAVWFIHEDIPELRFEDLGLIRRVTRLVAEDKLEIVVPSRQTAKDYNKFFSTDKVRVITLRVDVPARLVSARTESSFDDKLNFTVSGTPSDGRKGQLLAIAAFAKFNEDYYKKDPSKYRDYNLNLVAINKSGTDYLSTQIRAIGDGLMGERIRYYPKLPKDKALDIASLNDVTICCSLNETFALFVAEGMIMGHIILRNKTSGFHEQIKDGLNGFIIHERDIDDFASKIESLLNRKTASDTLFKMSRASQSMSENFVRSDYFDQLTP